MYLLVIIPALIIFYQDFQQREISWWTIPLLFISLLPESIANNEWSALFENTLVNISILLFELFFTSVYFSLKNKQLTNIFKKYLGIGDVLFLMSICPFFHPIVFVFYLTGSLIIILLVSLIYGLIKKKWNFTIPLAGIFSILLLITITYNHFSPFTHV
ncbi:MAG: hypothetical protein JXQ69_08140 [Paludibacteraceae bacterium]|nr:hypothetical protein [Paludibacteraceae bacterium]